MAKSVGFYHTLGGSCDFVARPPQPPRVRSPKGVFYFFFLFNKSKGIILNLIIGGWGLARRATRR